MPKPKLPKGLGKKPAPVPKKTDDELAYEELKKKLGHTKLMKANSAKMTALVQRAVKSLTPGQDTWLTEWGGRGLGNQVFDLAALLDIGGAFGNTVRWYARSIFPGGNEIGLPGARAAVAGSLVLVLGPGLTEKPRQGGEESFYPTVEGGRLLTATMASTNDHDQLTAIFGSLSRNAAKAYVNTLEVIVERQLGVTTYIAPGGEPRYTSLLLEQARDDLAWLSRPPSTHTTEIEVFGMFRAVDERRDGKFVLALEAPPGANGKPGPAEIVGKIAASLRHRAMTTRSRVKATIRVTEPLETWLPRAPRTEHVLIDFERAPRR
jgi:hypothetical protein